jgi:hypothetical protein
MNRAADHSAALAGIRAKLVDDLRALLVHRQLWRSPHDVERRSAVLAGSAKRITLCISEIRALDAVRQAANHSAHLLELLKARGESIGSIVAHNHEAGRRW